jgi:hypothetical protein
VTRAAEDESRNQLRWGCMSERLPDLHRCVQLHVVKAGGEVEKAAELLAGVIEDGDGGSAIADGPR